MKGYTGVNTDGQAIYWQDNKRWLWMLSVLFPLQPFIGIALHAATGVEAWLFLPLLLNYVLAPMADVAMGADRNNPPEEIVPQLDQDRYYRYLTYAIVPLHFVSLIGVAAYAGSQDLSIAATLGLAVMAGLAAGLAINTAHEMGHKNTKIERTLAKIALAVPAYGHFSIDHNRGHHRDVSTAADPSSARMGETFYRFVGRELPDVIARAWGIEKERLNNRGKSEWHPDNQILQSHAISVAIVIGLVIAFGWIMLPFMLIHNAVAWLQLSSANYIEHYGLLRNTDENGRVERCAPHHSWNCNRLFSNLALFHLERHSDHHSYPLRRYQSLRHYDDVPQLPTGYFGCYVLAYIPPLWFHVMDKRLLALPHVDGDLTKTNLDPAAREKLFERYGGRAAEAV